MPTTAQKMLLLMGRAVTVSVSPSSLPAGDTATPYSQTISASGGTAPYTYAISSGSLISGLVLSTNGVISGTPTASNTYNFAIRATDAAGHTGIQAYSVVVSDGTFIQDSFTGTDGTLLTSHTPNVDVPGTAYTSFFANTLKILSNKAVVTANATNCSAVIDVTHADTTLTVDYTHGNTGVVALYIRATDVNNTWSIVWATGTWTLYSYASGTPTVRATAAQTLNNAQVYALRVVCLGDVITFSVDGVQKITFTLSLYNTKTIHGLFANNTAQAFDNLVVTSPQGTNKMLGYGDSITAGFNASDAAHRWLNLINATLGYTLINAGISATQLQNTVQNSVSTIGAAADNNGQDTLASRVTALHPTKVFVLYGLNDLRLNDVAYTTAKYQASLDAVVSALLATGIGASNIYLGSPPYIPVASYALGAPYDGGSTVKHQAYRDAVAAVATIYSTRYIDVYGWMIAHGGDTLISVDGIHPNDSGHAAIANAFLSVL